MEEKINLNLSQISDLYKGHLINIDLGNQNDLPANDSYRFDYKGGYHKKILWLHKESDHAYINDDDFDMVTKILEACKMTWDDIALINVAKIYTDQEIVFHQLKPEYIINSIGENNDYVVNIKSDIKTLFTDPLSQIRNDKSLKVRLWQSLKVFFDLK
jgi:hypothetical protein